MSGPRVMVVAPLYHTDRGGLGRQAVLLTERLARLGARPLVVTRRMIGLPPRRFAPGVRLLPVPAGRPEVHNYERANLENLLTALRFTGGLLVRMVRERDHYELMHFHGASLPLLLALPCAGLLGKKVIGKVAALHQGVEAGDLAGHYGPVGPCLAWLAARADAFVATTREIGEALRREGVPAECIVRVPNFVDVAQFQPPAPAERKRLRAELGWSGRTVVLHSGRLTARKAGDVLIRAFARAAPAVREAAPLLAFLGDGPEREAWGRVVAAEGLGEQVQFLGFHEQVTRYLGAADLLCVSSLVEGLPNALLEGMAMGLPVLATRLGGSLEVVLEGETGLLVPPGEVAPLAAGLRRFLGDTQLRRAMGRAGADRIRAQFTIEAIAPRYLDLYRRLLRGEAPGGASLFPMPA